MSSETAPKVPAIVEQIPSHAGGISALGSANAPILFVDGVPTFGQNNQIINATLTAARYHGVQADHVVVAHLRLPIPTAQLLAESLLKAITMLEKPEGPAN